MSQFFTLGLIGHIIIGGNPGFGFGLPGLLALPHPLQFALQRFLFGFILTGFLRQTLCLLLKPSGIIAFIGHALPPINFEDPAGNIIEKIAVVSHNEDCPGIVNQVFLQPSNGFSVQVVGRLIKQQHIRLLEQ